MPGIGHYNGFTRHCEINSQLMPVFWHSFILRELVFPLVFPTYVQFSAQILVLYFLELIQQTFYRFFLQVYLHNNNNINNHYPYNNKLINNNE